jgi:membrane fusion protein (multidrug efflux system)
MPETMKTVKRTTVILTTVFLIGCSQGADDARSAATSAIAMQAQESLPRIAVEGRTVTEGSLIGRIEASGLVRGIGEAWAVSETQGLVESVTFQLGDQVSEGDVLASLDPSLEKINLAQAEAQLESARLDLAATERLYDGGNASLVELARKRSAAAGAQAAVETARRALANRTIRAPISGRIADKTEAVSRGNYLNPGNRIARIVDTSRLQVEIALGEREIPYIRQGGAASVELPVCEGAPMEASVVAIAAAGDPSTGSFPVIVEWPNGCDNDVRVGMSAFVSMVPDDDRRILVPSTAVFAESGAHFVYAAENSVAKRREITIGRRSGNAIEVTSGLDVGAVVVTAGLARVTDGSPVDVTIVGDTGAL